MLKIQFQVRFGNEDVERFTASADENGKYFLPINPAYNQQNGALVIVPVTLTNMAHTVVRYFTRQLRKGLLRAEVWAPCLKRQDRQPSGKKRMQKIFSD